MSLLLAALVSGPSFAGAADPYLPPDTEPRATIDAAGPFMTSKQHLKVVLTFSSNQENSTFACSLEKGQSSLGYPEKKEKPCVSPATYRIKAPGLRHGKRAVKHYSFYVRPIGPTGIRGQIAGGGFNVVRKPVVTERPTLRLTDGSSP